VIAARLAEAFPHSGPSILIIEAGPDSKGLQNVTMVGGLFQAMGGELDWDFKTVPQKHMNDRVLNLARGKFLGGSSGFNGTLCIRGNKADYDEWGLNGWSGDDMFRCMKKVEAFNGKDWFRAAESEHGRDGPLQTEPHDPAPISDLILAAMQEKGLKSIDDVFTTGESANACGHVPRSVHQGTRSFATDYLRGHEDRIDIVVHTVVNKVILEQKPDGLVASGIILTFPGGQSTTIKARKEVIISSGTSISRFMYPTYLLIAQVPTAHP
jgi:choline dehydrogenase-like flavoprotein